MLLGKLFRHMARARTATRALARAHASVEADDLTRAEAACDACRDLPLPPGCYAHVAGLLALRKGNASEAVVHFQQAVDANGAEPAFRLSLGQALAGAQRAGAAAQELAQALELLSADDPRRTSALLLLADAHRDAGDRSRADAVYAQVLARDPQNTQALTEQAMQRFHESDIGVARELLDRDVAARPTSAAARLRRAALLPAIVSSAAQIDEVLARFDRDLEQADDMRLAAIADPAAEVGLLPFFLAYYGRECRDPMERYYRVCSRFYAPRSASPRRSRGKRLRVGFVSTFFYGHSIGRTTFGLIADLPREHFEVLVFSISPHDDPWAQAIARHCDTQVVLPTRLEVVREAIAGAELDVLFFADVGMHPLTYFLSYARLAPVQLTTWGHPVTTGVGTMDYFVSHEALEGPGAQAHYREKLLLLPAFFMPRYQKSELAQPRSRRELGLPEDRRLYLCPQTLFKLHPDFDVALRRILEGDARGELILLEGHPRWTEQLRRRFRATLAGAESRVRFMSQRKHHEFLHLLAAADVVLDPFYFGGNNSSCEALGLGLPVVTLPAERVAGRFTQALYREMDFTDCVAASPEDYVRRALELGMEPERRKAVSQEIHARNDRIFQRADAGRALGEALLRIVR